MICNCSYEYSAFSMDIYFFLKNSDLKHEFSKLEHAHASIW